MCYVIPWRVDAGNYSNGSIYESCEGVGSQLIVLYPLAEKSQVYRGFSERMLYEGRQTARSGPNTGY